MSTSIVITGGAGFIGSHLAQLLHGRGHALTIIDDLSTGHESNIAPLLGPRCRLIRATVGDALRQEPGLLRGAGQIYHLAASVGVQLVVKDPAAIIRNNVQETAALLQAARGGGAPGAPGAAVLIASSSEVYGRNTAVPLREDADLIFGPTTQPRWSYALSKAVDEHLALAHHAAAAAGGAGGPAVVVRLFNTIGPRQVGHYGMVVPRFVQAAVRGDDLTIYGDGLQTRAFCDVRDVVDAMTRLLAEPRCHGQVFNIGSPQEITVAALADLVIELASSRSRKRLVPFDEAYGPGFEDPFRRRVPDVTKVAAAVGWRPVRPLAETLKELIAMERAAG